MQTKVLSLTLSLGKRNWTSTTVCITTTIIITILVVSIRVFFFLSYICNYGSHDIWLSTIDKNRVCKLASQKFTYTHPLLFIAKRAWKCLNFTSPHCLKFTKKNHWNFLKLPLNCNAYFCLKSNFAEIAETFRVLSKHCELFF